MGILGGWGGPQEAKEHGDGADHFRGGGQQRRGVTHRAVVLPRVRQGEKL